MPPAGTRLFEAEPSWLRKNPLTDVVRIASYLGRPNVSLN